MSSLKSFNAGTIDYYKFSSPITLFSSSSLLNRFSLTSEDSSRSKARKIGKISSFVGPFSTIGDTARRFSAKAYLTYPNWSSYNFLRFGITLLIRVSASRIVPKSLRRLMAAVLTSDSESSKKEM